MFRFTQHDIFNMVSSFFLPFYFPFPPLFLPLKNHTAPNFFISASR